MAEHILGEEGGREGEEEERGALTESCFFFCVCELQSTNKFDQHNRIKCLKNDYVQHN